MGTWGLPRPSPPSRAEAFAWADRISRLGPSGTLATREWATVSADDLYAGASGTSAVVSGKSIKLVRVRPIDRNRRGKQGGQRRVKAKSVPTDHIVRHRMVITCVLGQEE